MGLFDEVDDDHDGYLHYTEFLAATLETDGKEVTDDMLAEAFDQLDMDDSGFISTENLQEFLGKDSKVRGRCALIIAPSCQMLVQHGSGFVPSCLEDKTGDGVLPPAWVVMA